MNKVVLIGRLTKDPVVRRTQTDKVVAAMTIAVDRMGKDKGADFIPVVMWNKTAEIAEKHLKKGVKIAVDGSINTRTYDDDKGKHYITEVICREFEFCEKKAASDEQGVALQATDYGSDDDIPF